MNHNQLTQQLTKVICIIHRDRIYNTAGGTINYQWQKKDYGSNAWINIPGATSPTFNTPVTTQADGGDEFRVGLTSVGATPTLSQSAVLTINIGSTTVDNFSPDQIFDDN